MTALILLTLVAASWTTIGPDWFPVTDDGTRPDFKNVSFTPGGEILLAPALDSLAAPEESAVWSLAGDGGDLWLGTGNQGRVYRRTPGGTPELIFDGGPGQVLAIAATRGGVLYGLTPGGTIHRLRGNQSELVVETGEDYIFDLLPGPNGEVWIATGAGGRLLRLSPGSVLDTAFACGQAHVTCLAWLEPGRTLLAGTSPDGIVYRLELPPGAGPLRATVLYDTPLEEIRRVALAGDNVYVAANPAEEADNGASGSVWCVELDGIPRWSWECADGLVFDILPAADGLLVATGNRGNLCRLDSLGRPTLVQRVEQSQLTRLAAADKGAWVGAAGPAGLYRLGSGSARAGHVVSSPFDCASRARFGRLEYRAEIPAGTELAFDTRSGNAELPDSTWSDWLPVNGAIKSPPARFVQWRARLASRFPDRTPALSRVDLHYDIPNRPPAVTGLDLEQLDPGEAARGEARPVRNLTWTAEDPDSDGLEHTVLFKGEGETTWKELAKGTAETTFQLDTRVLADGLYRFRVVATDAPARAAGTALAAERTTAPVLVDNTPPLVTDLAVRGDELTFTARDAASNIAGARWSVNAGDWLPVGPADGIIDSNEERFRVKVELEPGESVVAVRVADRAGNTTTARTVVRR